MNQYNLTMEQITAYRTWLSGEEKSAGTIEKYLRDIGAFARWLKGAPVSKDRTSEWKTLWRRGMRLSRSTPCWRR